MLLWGCGDLDQKPTNHSVISLTGPFTTCRTYVQEDIFSYCIYQKAEHLETLKDVHYYCPLAKEWEEACRHVWGAKRAREPRGLSFMQLIDGCGGFSDCAFEVIDRNPSKDISIQLKRCYDYVVADIKDCVGHAMQMWLNQKPTKEEIRIFMDKEVYLSETELYFIAKEDFCRGENVCVGSSNNDKKCRQFQKKIKSKPNACHSRWGNIKH